MHEKLDPKGVPKYKGQWITSMNFQFYDDPPPSPLVHLVRCILSYQHSEVTVLLWCTWGTYGLVQGRAQAPLSYQGCSFKTVQGYLKLPPLTHRRNSKTWYQMDDGTLLSTTDLKNIYERLWSECFSLFQSRIFWKMRFLEKMRFWNNERHSDYNLW